MDGLIKNEEIYNIFNTTEILNRPLSIIITDKSGASAVVHWVNQRLNLTGDKALDKKHPGIIKMAKAIQKQYEEGRITSMSTKEMEKLARKYLPQCFASEFDRLKAKAKELAYHVMEAIIENPELKSMEPARQEPAMEAVLGEHPFIQFLFVTDANGIKTTKNITHITDRAKFEAQGLGDNLSDRVWFVEPMKDGKIHVTDFYTSRFTSALCITVSGPIRNEEDEIVGVIGLDIRFEDLAKMEDDKNSEE